MENGGLSMTEKIEQEFYQVYLSGALTPNTSKITDVSWYSSDDEDEVTPNEENVYITTLETYSYKDTVWKVVKQVVNGKIESLVIKR
jgi:hypothetical protein